MGLVKNYERYHGNGCILGNNEERVKTLIFLDSWIYLNTAFEKRVFNALNHRNMSCDKIEIYSLKFVANIQQ